MDKKRFASRFKEAVAHAGVDDTQEALGRLLGVSPVMIWSYRSGEKMPRMATAMRIAEKLGVSVSWLLSGNGSMVESIATKITRNVSDGPDINRTVPLISWIQAGDWCEAEDPYQNGDAETWLPVSSKYGARSYALRVRGESMLPRFREGEIIVVDPDAEAVSADFVIARKSAGEVTFKQLVIEGSAVYLKPLNPQWPEPIIKISGDWSICGKVVCKMELF